VLNGHPIIAYTIAAAIESKVFSKVIVSTDSESISEISRYYGAEAPFLRPPELATDLSPDIDWVEHALDELALRGHRYDCFSILRPTSPFRQARTIRRAWEQFRRTEDVDSLRAVEKCKQHPGKMWVLNHDRMDPLLPCGPSNPPWHSTPYQGLPEVYVQNASLEIAWCRVVTESRSISGEKVMPFLTEGIEGLDINDLKDWWYAEYLLKQGEAFLPNVSKEPFRTELTHRR
jgi:N-acylneuraminate cytidylyltransferase